METDFNLLQLFLPALFIAAVGLIVTYWTTHSPAWTAAIVAVKTGLFLGYWLPARYIYPGDGTAYFLESALFEKISWTGFFSDPEAAFGSGHWGYYLFNWASRQVFGDLYIAPIALNVALTYVSGYLLYRTLLLLGLDRHLAVFAAAFYLVSPEVLTWSTLFNLKDILVQFLTILYVYLVARRLDGRTSLLGMAALAVPVMAVTTLRIYVPLVMAAHFIAVEAWMQRRRLRPSYLAIGGLAIVGLGYLITRGLGVDYPIASTPVRPPGEVIFGFGKIVMTPVPWGIDQPYTYTLLPAAWFHWLLMPFAALGLLTAARRYPRTLILVLYAVGMFLLLALFTNLLGPRHRFQVSFVLVVFQAMGLYPLLMAPVWRYCDRREMARSPERGPLSVAPASLPARPG